MDDFLTKPVRPAELLAAIDRLARAPGGRTQFPRQARRIPGGRRLLDPVALLTACGGEAEWLRGLCQDFQAYVPARLAEMGEALRDRDAPRLRQAAHKLWLCCPHSPRRQATWPQTSKIMRLNAGSKRLGPWWNSSK